MKREGQAGFTLVEMLIVLAIVGIMSGMTLLAIGGMGRGAQPENEARLFANRLSLASDDALVTDTALSLHIDAQGYRVEKWSEKDKEWIAHPDRLFGAHHELPAGISMKVAGEPERIMLRPDGTGTPFSVAFSDSERSWRVFDDGLFVHTQAAPL